MFGYTIAEAYVHKDEAAPSGTLIRTEPLLPHRDAGGRLCSVPTCGGLTLSMDDSRRSQVSVLASALRCRYPIATMRQLVIFVAFAVFLLVVAVVARSDRRR